MADHDDAHDSHGSAPVAATIVALVVVAIFTAAFSKLHGSDAPTGALVVIAALMTVFSLLWIWVLDRD
jgi:hypothetical protein